MPNELEEMARKLEEKLINASTKNHTGMIADALRQVREKTILESLNIINDDAYAISFQSMAQYRSALIKSIRKLGGGK